MASMKLMTNILPSYYSFIDKEAKRQHRTKRDIIEEAIGMYMRQRKKEEIVKSYEAMSKDSEYLDEMTRLAEEGMEYFLTDIDACK